MKKLLYFFIPTFSILIGSESDQFEAILPQIRTLYATNRFREQLERGYEYREALKQELPKNASVKTSLKKALQNIVTLQDIKTAIMPTIGGYLYDNQSELIANTRHLIFGNAPLMSRLFICHYNGKDAFPWITNTFFTTLAQNKILQLRGEIDTIIPKKVTQKINYLSPLLTQKDILDLAAAGAQVTAKQAIKQRTIAPKFDDRMKKKLALALTAQYAHNKTKDGLKYLNKKFEIYSPEALESILNNEIVDLVLYAGVNMCVRKTVTTCLRISDNVKMQRERARQRSARIDLLWLQSEI